MCERQGYVSLTPKVPLYRLAIDTLGYPIFREAERCKQGAQRLQYTQTARIRIPKAI